MPKKRIADTDAGRRVKKRRVIFMRYYSLVLKTTSEKIEEGAKIRINDYLYGDPIGALSVYMYKNLKNGVYFFAYREEENAVLAVFAYDDKTTVFGEAYDHILGILSGVFSVKQIKSEPVEITVFQSYEHYLEARRRGYAHNISCRVVESLNMEFLNDYYKDGRISPRYTLNEKIISEKFKTENPMYDTSVINELANIEAHQNASDFSGNMVHYFISGKSAEAANDITETLVQRLAKANRISGRRMEIISEIHPHIYAGQNYLEDIIENNYGGVMVMDLSCKLEFESTQYAMACKYIEGLVKRYKNDCLFVFTYNSDAPGFAYELLSALSKCVIPFKLKEGSGDRKAALKYLKELIKASEYAEYAGQASEFMKMFPGNELSQTDVLMAFEQFGAWSFNKNILHAYDCVSSDAFMLDRDENNDSSYDKLNNMIGLTGVKEQIDNIVAADIVERERKKRMGKDYEAGTMHMIFSGNPGTAKTTVAKLFAGIAKEKGILKSGAFVECGGMDLDGFGCGVKIRQAFKKAEGGVLFIDEAYSLCDYHENSFGNEAINTLVQEMENHRDDVIVIFAGYSDKMKSFLDRNPGMASRIAFHVDFEDYTVNELCGITSLLLSKKRMTITNAAMEKLEGIYEKARQDRGFGNGRFVRKMLEEAEMNLAERVSRLPESELTEELITTVEETDVPEFSESKLQPERRRVGF